MRDRVAVVGAGSWGTALTGVLRRHGLEVSLWVRDPTRAEKIARTGQNHDYLPDIAIEPGVVVSSDLSNVCSGAGIVVLAVPTQSMRAVTEAARPCISTDAVVVSAAKGFEEKSLLTMTALVRSVLEASAPAVVAMSGPNIAIEIARGLPAATVVAGEGSAVQRVRDLCSGKQLRFYSSDDVIGVEFGGALKNVVAIAAGMCDGIGIGDNGKAAIITRGLAELARVGVAAGGRALTFSGLTGLGDCTVTCMSPHSRNRRLGEAIARGQGLADALAASSMVVEGVHATRCAVELSQRLQVEMPIAEELSDVLFGGKAIPDAFADLMGRGPGDEMRGFDTSGAEQRRSTSRDRRRS
ncbi:MAG: NAD(P)H-dependent glycerol-3-phosphate dehydrogenase [Candidatus Dormibacteria bacterium]